MAGGRPQADVEYTSFPPLPFEADGDEDLIDTLRLLSMVNTSLPTCRSSTNHLPVARSCPLPSGPDPLLPFHPTLRPLQVINTATPEAISGLRPVITSFPQIAHLPLPSSVLSIPVFASPEVSNSVIPAILPAPNSGGLVTSTVEETPPAVLQNTPPRFTGTQNNECTQLPSVAVPAPRAGIHNLPTGVVTSTPNPGPSPPRETVIEVSEHRCTVGRCRIDINASSLRLSCEVCPECDPAIIQIRLRAIVDRANRDAWVDSTKLEIVSAFGDLSYFSRSYSMKPSHARDGTSGRQKLCLPDLARALPEIAQQTDTIHLVLGRSKSQQVRAAILC